MTENFQIHKSFGQVAPLQTFSMDQLLLAVARLKKHDHDRIQRAIERLQTVLSTDDDRLLGIRHLVPLDVDGPREQYSRAHNCGIILRFMKSQGVERLELDTSKDLCEQIMILGMDRKNCPQDMRVSPIRGNQEGTRHMIIGYELEWVKGVPPAAPKPPAVAPSPSAPSGH